MFATRCLVLPAVIAATLSLAACQHGHPSTVPPSATMLAEGTGRLAHTASSDGTIYVYDADTDKLLYSGKVNRGQMLVVDSDRDSLSLDGRPVLEKDLERNHTRRIYFLPSETTVRTEVRTSVNGAPTAVQTERTETTVTPSNSTLDGPQIRTERRETTVNPSDTQIERRETTIERHD